MRGRLLGESALDEDGFVSTVKARRENMLGVVAKEHVHQAGVRRQLAGHNAHRFVGNGDDLGEHFLHGRCVAIVEGMEKNAHCAGERLRKIQNVVIHGQEGDTGLFQLDMTVIGSGNYLKSLELFH